MPIACSIHSAYELAALGRMRLRVDAALENGNLIRGLECRAVDVQTRSDGEFLIAADAEGSRWALRLDRLRQVLSADTGRPLDPERTGA